MVMVMLVVVNGDGDGDGDDVDDGDGGDDDDYDSQGCQITCCSGSKSAKDGTRCCGAVGQKAVRAPSPPSPLHWARGAVDGHDELMMILAQRAVLSRTAGVAAPRARFDATCSWEQAA